jgi:hypothetical protein
MNSGPDDEFRQPSEPTFADVMNGFSLDNGRSSRRRRWGRRRGEDAEPGSPEAADPADAPQYDAPQYDAPQYGAPQYGADTYRAPAPAPAPESAVAQAGLPTGPIGIGRAQPEQYAPRDGAAAVRPYAWTRGRTRSGFDLAIETLISTSARGREQMMLLQVEHRAVAELCSQTRSVAEVAALMSLPLGVARVLLGDLAGLGVVTVHQTASSAGNAPDLALMERVLSGLRRL